MVVSEINLVSFNCRGLCGRHKRRDVLNMFRNYPHDIICLQDIHVSKNDVSMFLSQWRGVGYFSCLNRISRGYVSCSSDRFNSHYYLNLVMRMGVY